jgi:hypothetical protein
MDQHVAERWTQALRSGKYKQARGRLKDGPEYFCCLGVLCDLYREEQGKGEWVTPKYCESSQFEVECDGLKEVEGVVLPDSVREWAGMETHDGYLEGTQDTSLASLNDRGVKFPQMADLIEKQWEVL